MTVKRESQIRELKCDTCGEKFRWKATYIFHKDKCKKNRFGRRRENG